MITGTIIFTSSSLKQCFIHLKTQDITNNASHLPEDKRYYKQCFTHLKTQDITNNASHT